PAGPWQTGWCRRNRSRSSSRSLDALTRCPSTGRCAGSAAILLQQRGEVTPVLAVAEAARRRGYLFGPDIAHVVGDLLDAGDLQPLAHLDRADELGRLDQRLVRAGVEPGGAAAEPLDPQPAGA